MNSNSIENKQNQYGLGLACALICAVIWGTLPIYWKSFEGLNPFVLILYRLVLAFVFVLVICLFTYKPKEIFRPLKKKRTLWMFFFAGLTISTNWSIYIWAVNAGFVIQTGIGYYIEPLLVALMGIVLFREKLDAYKIIAVALAVIGVLVMVVSFGQAPTIALSIAITFAAYAGIKKKLKAPSLLAFFYETGLLLPIIIPCIFYMEATGNGLYGKAESYQLVLLSFSGIITAVPLLLFAMAANRIDIITLGLTEYITPTLALVLGIFLYKESFDTIQLAGLVIVWIGLAISTVGGIKESYRRRPPSSVEHDQPDVGG